MKVAVSSTRSYDREFLSMANSNRHDLIYLEAKLNQDTASLADGFPAVCAFVNDQLNEAVLRILHQQGTRLIALRSAGFNHVDVRCADQLGLTVARVPAYSPHAVAEHALVLILSLNRKIHRAFNRVREANFSLDGLLGFDMVGKAVGVIGTGKIGAIFALIMNAMGCKVAAYDPFPDPALAGFVRYVSLPQLYADADIISLHCPLMPETQHLINETSNRQMKEGVMLIFSLMIFLRRSSKMMSLCAC
jgi:D-lactate dehydrogenase